MRWVLDSKVYVRASQHREARRALDFFNDRHFAQTDLAATVLFELQVGIRSRAVQRVFDDWVSTFGERDSILIPSALAFRQAGRVLGALGMEEGLVSEAVRPSFHHDVVLACTVREHGRTLVTSNAQGFARIQRHLKGFRFRPPYPG